jgi:hypothetical protein
VRRRLRSLRFNPLGSEDEAFRLLLYAIAVVVVIALVAVLLRTIL